MHPLLEGERAGDEQVSGDGKCDAQVEGGKNALGGAGHPRRPHAHATTTSSPHGLRLRGDFRVSHKVLAYLVPTLGFRSWKDFGAAPLKSWRQPFNC